MTRSMFDVLYLPNPVPSGFDIAAGYIPSPGISHVWSSADWGAALRVCKQGLLPIAGMWQPFGSPSVDANNQRLYLNNIGFGHGIARGLDVEESQAGAPGAFGYIDGWANTVLAQGDIPVVYTSASCSGLIPKGIRQWLAGWNNVSHQEGFSSITQWMAPTTNPGTNVDWNTVYDNDLHFWGGPALPNPPTGGVMGFPIICAHPTKPDSYWVCTDDGAVYAYGQCQYHGGVNSLHLNAPIVGMASNPDGSGYWLLGDDRGVFALGNCRMMGHP